MDLDYYWVIPGKLAGASYPFNSLRGYHEVGFRAIVSLVPVPLPVEPEIEELGLEHLEVPLSLFGWPDDDEAVEIMEFIDGAIEKGLPVLVHCLQGNGRTGAVLGQFLVWKGVPAAEAVDRVYAARPTAFDSKEQEGAVLEFERQLRERRKASGKPG
ncbi:MAG: protein-tyrosine phosphatase family protein [Promethearchaeota archaeon]